MEDAIARLLLGESAAIREIRELITRVARTALAVSIEGETGGGKELVARAIHAASGRTGKFAAFSVCAIAETMVEDALFGHVRGAFTSAHADARGYLYEADRGTVFLDEIGGVAPPVQAKLLRAIETGEFRPVGAPADVCSHFRTVSASHESLFSLVAADRFRADLAERLAAVTIHVPPLRERLDDIPLLAHHFAAEARQTHELVGVLSDGAIHALQRYDWPRNVRQLRHVVETAIAFAATPRVTGVDIAAVLRRSAGDAHGASNRQTAERDELIALLTAVDWNRDRAAAQLGVHPVTVFRWMKRLGIRPPARHRRRPGSNGAQQPADE